MTQQIIDVGGNTPNNGQGETLRSGAVKINENFSELYAAVGIGGDQTFVNNLTAGTGISLSAANGDVIITNTLPNVHAFNTVSVSGQPSVFAAGNQALTLVAGSNVVITTTPASNSVTLTATQQPADWNAVSGPTAIQNKPNIPAAQVQSDWAQATTSAVDFIKNKPIVPTDLVQLTDVTFILNEDSIKTFSHVVPSLAASGTAEVYASSVNDLQYGLTAKILVIGNNGTGSLQSQITEVIVARSFPTVGDPVVQLIVTGSAYTGGSALATVAAAWDAPNFRMHITATNLSSTDVVQVKVIATELRA
jgi:hypothetical protein